MAERCTVLRPLVKRPFKIVKNFFKVQILTSLLAAIVVGVFFPSVPIPTFDGLNNAPKSKDILFTKVELSQFNGEKGKPLYLALLGSVFDVSRGVKHYGPGCEYNFFIGRDASVSFITGEFDLYDPEESDDVVKHVQGKNLLGLDNWKNFYNKDYIYKGKLIGRFYDERGAMTTYHYKYLALLEQAQLEQQKIKQLSELYPDCNIEWSEKTGTHVWCTETSGGKNRNWIGHPRKLFEIGSENFRCACIKEEDFNTSTVMLKEYENCPPEAFECFYHVEES